MKIDEIIEQCNELLDDKTYFLQTIELTKEEINILIQEIERLNNIINELEKWLELQKHFIINIPTFMEQLGREHKIMFNDYQNILNKLQELKGEDK